MEACTINIFLALFGLQVIYGIVYRNPLVPFSLRTGTTYGARIALYLSFSIGMPVSLFREHRPEFRVMG